MKAHQSHYGHLAIMTAASFAAMYFLMYAMVDALPNVFMNVNQLYMAGLMAAPMVLIELVVMRSMYQDRRRNLAFAAGAVAVLIACWLGIRTQAAVGDRQFLRSMIPHHAGALLMCREAAIDDSDIRDLCRTIQQGQQEEIDQMKTMLRRMSSGAATERSE